MSEPTRLSLDELGRVLAEPARLRILQELLGGTALPAGALAARIGLAASTTSGHLAKLSEAGLIDIELRGRNRLATISDPAVSAAVEALLRLTGEPAVNSATTFDRRAAMREARSCYDHLAGRVGVAVADIARERGWVSDVGGAWTLGADPAQIADEVGLALTWPHTSRPAVLTCADWTERRPHIAGRLGRAILDAMMDAGWLRRRSGDRALTINSLGRTRLTELGVSGL